MNVYKKAPIDIYMKFMDFLVPGWDEDRKMVGKRKIPSRRPAHRISEEKNIRDGVK